jgi:hypothetical protein
VAKRWNDWNWCGRAGCGVGSAQGGAGYVRGAGTGVCDKVCDCVCMRVLVCVCVCVCVCARARARACVCVSMIYSRYMYMCACVYDICIMGMCV